MGVWEFVVVYLAAFVLVQLAIYRYLRGRGDENGTRMTFAGPPNADRGPGDDHERRDLHDHERREHRTLKEPTDHPRDEEEPVQRCPSCGATNEPDGPYTFCRNCASRLPG